MSTPSLSRACISVWGCDTHCPRPFTTYRKGEFPSIQHWLTYLRDRENLSILQEPPNNISPDELVKIARAGRWQGFVVIEQGRTGFDAPYPSILHRLGKLTHADLSPTHLHALKQRLKASTGCDNISEAMMDRYLAARPSSTVLSDVNPTTISISLDYWLFLMDTYQFTV